MMIPVTISETALKAMEQIKSGKNIPDFYGLRIGIKGGGGCGGFSYVLGFDYKQDGDAEFMYNGLLIYIEKKQMMYVAGKTIDFIETAEGQGFVFK